MKHTTAFGKALTAVISYPVYAIFAVILIVYACLGNWAEALLLAVALFLSVLLRALLLSVSVFRNTPKQVASVQSGSLMKMRNVSFRISVICALCAVPLLIFALIKPAAGGLSVALSRILSVMALGLSVFCGAAGSPMETVASLQLTPKNGEETGFSVKSIDAAEKIAGCDKVLILNPLLLYDNTQEVRSVFFAGAQYRGYSLSESAMKTPAEICFLVSGFVQCVTSGRTLTLPEQREKALDDFAEARIPEKQGVSFYFSDFKPYYDRLCKGDIAVRVRSENGTYIAYRSTSADALSLCSCQRTADGEAKEFDPYGKKALREALGAMRSENMVTYIYITFPGTELPDGTADRGVLEAVIGVGGVCPASNAEAAEALEDFGVTPLLALPAENSTAKGLASVCGLCRREDQICTASEWRNNAPHDRSFADTRAFLGFTGEELRDAVRTVAAEGQGLCIVPLEAADLSLLNLAKTAAAVEQRCVPEVERVADSMLRPASLDDRRSGFPALFSLFTEACTVLCKLTMLRNILLVFGSFLVFLFAIALFCGADAILPSASQILLSGSALTAAAVFCVLDDKVLMQSREVLETEKKAVLLSCIRCAAIGLLSSVAASICGMLVFSGSAADARNYIFVSMFAVGLSDLVILRLTDRRRYGISGWNLTLLFTVLIGLTAVLFLSFVRFPEAMLPAFGRSLQPLRTLLFAMIPAAVPFVFLWSGKALHAFTGR